jgi:hypothetical protein
VEKKPPKILVRMLRLQVGMKPWWSFYDIYFLCSIILDTFDKNKNTKGHFILRPSVKRTRDSSNLIGGEPKFVHSAFTLEANGQ